MGVSVSAFGFLLREGSGGKFLTPKVVFGKKKTGAHVPASSYCFSFLMSRRRLDMSSLINWQGSAFHLLLV